MDLRHKRTGRVDKVYPGFFELFIDDFFNAVSANDDGSAAFGLVGGFDHRHALFQKVIDDLGIVDDRAESRDLFAFFKQLIDELHRAVDAETEAGGFREPDRHNLSLIVERTSSTDSSSSFPLVSRRIASSACLSGAISLWESL